MKNQSWLKLNEFCLMIMKIAEVLNNFFSNVVEILGSPKNAYSNLFVGDIDDPALRTSEKYRQHPTILTTSYYISNNRKM